VSRRELVAGFVEVDHGGAGRGERVEGMLDLVQHRLWRRHVVEPSQANASDAEPCPLQPVRVHELRVVGRDVGWPRPASALPAERYAAGCWVAAIERPTLDHP